MTPQEYILIKKSLIKVISDIYKRIDAAEDLAQKSKPPLNLRKATSNDIVVNNIIWYKDDCDKSIYFWKIVENIIKPDDRFKAYYAHDGCRYGLKDAYVEKIKK